VTRNWHYMFNEDQHGPVAEGDLLSLIRQRKIPLSARVWTEGMPEWLPVTESPVAESLSDVFQERMRTWVYHIEHTQITDRWGAKRQAQEIQTLNSRLNQLGQEGWELISLESIPLTGGFTGNVNGYLYLSFFKKQT
jgi:hypothetical protein